MKLSTSILNLALVAIFAALIFSCNSDDPKKSYDIYVLGYSTPIDLENGSPRHVSYWKNGEEFQIGDGTTTIFPSGIAVDGDDVYVGGIEYPENGAGLATYWKNGTAVRLSNGTKTEGVRGITVVDGVVYACGYESENGGEWVAKYWKNGTPVILPTDAFASADDIVVIGSDVHVIGFESTADTVYAHYWKNGTIVPVGSKTTYRLFSDIVAQGNDVFIAGYDDVNSPTPFGLMKSQWWKNGDEAGTVINGYLTNGMAVSNNDVYVTAQHAAGYSKNGTFVEIKPFENLTRFWSPSIAVSGDDVILVTASHAPNDKLLGSYLFVNGEAQAPFIGDDEKTELLAVVVK